MVIAREGSTPRIGSRLSAPSPAWCGTRCWYVTPRSFVPNFLTRVVAAPPPAEAKKLTAPPEVTTTPLIRQNVLKASTASPLRSALESFASDGSIPNALSATTSVGAMDLPDLFRSVMAPPLASLTTPSKNGAAQNQDAQATPGLFSPKRVSAALNMPAMPELPPSVQPYKDVTQQLIALAREHLPGREELQTWWTRERVDRHVQLALPHRKLDAMVVEGEHVAALRLSKTSPRP